MTADFWQLLASLPTPIQQATRKAYRLFKDNPVHPSLHFERLTYDPRLWSVRVSRSYRAVGVREGDTIIGFWIGHHPELDQRFPK